MNKPTKKPKHHLILAGKWHTESPGGAYKIAQEFAYHLAADGHKVSLLASTDQSHSKLPINVEGVNIWLYRSPKFKSPSLKNLFQHIRRTQRLISEIEAKLTIDTVNGHDHIQFLAGALSNCYSREIQKSLCVHSPLLMEHLAHWNLPTDATIFGIFNKLGAKKSLAALILRIIETATYKSADKLIAFSRFTVQQLIHDYPRAVHGKISSTNLWVDLERYQVPTVSKASVRSNLGAEWDYKGPIFFTLRRLVPRTGVDILLQAAANLKSQGFEFRLIVGGIGPELENYRRLTNELNIKNIVEFIGRVAEEDLPRCYQASDCFLLPSRSLECFGLTILEAYASGVPVIATPTGAIPEVMSNIGKSLLAEQISPQAIEEKMREFLNAPDLHLAENYRNAAEKFSIVDCAARLANHL